MNKLFQFLLVLCLSYGSVSSQEQWSLFAQVTNDNCEGCGSYGWEMMQAGIAAVEDLNVIILNIHESGALSNEISTAISENYITSDETTPPLFFANDENLMVNSDNIESALAVMDEVITISNLFDPFAAVTTTANYDGVNLNTQSAVEFFEEVEGNYSLATYLVKDSVLHTQSGLGEVHHRMLIMGELFDSPFGVAFASPIGIDYAKNLSVPMEIPAEELEDYRIVSVIWNFIEPIDTYRFFNATITPIENLATYTDDTNLLEDFSLILDNKKLNIDTQSNDDYEISVLAVDGKGIAKRSFNTSASIDLSQVSQQIVLVNIQSKGRQATKKLFIR